MAQNYDTWKNAPTEIVQSMPDGTSVTYRKDAMTRELSEKDVAKLAKHLRKIHEIMRNNDIDACVDLRLWMHQRKASLKASSWTSADIKMGGIRF